MIFPADMECLFMYYKGDLNYDLGPLQQLLTGGRMKHVGIAVLAFMLTGCLGPYFEYTPVIGSDGTKHYLLKSPMSFIEASKGWATKDLDSRSKQICPAGYNLINEEIMPVNNPAGFHSGSFDMHWQIKCKNLS